MSKSMSEISHWRQKLLIESLMPKCNWTVTQWTDCLLSCCWGCVWCEWKYRCVNTVQRGECVNSHLHIYLCVCMSMNRLLKRQPVTGQGTELLFEVTVNISCWKFTELGKSQDVLIVLFLFLIPIRTTTATPNHHKEMQDKCKETHSDYTDTRQHKETPRDTKWQLMTEPYVFYQIFSHAYTCTGHGTMDCWAQASLILRPDGAVRSQFAPR